MPMKILIAEDDPLMMVVIKQQLLNEGYSLSMNADGREALEALESFRPDLIITDILMPFASGLDLITVVRSSGNKVPILVLSAMDQEATVLEAFKPDLIITDILMPFTSGLDLISVVRSSGNKVPILVLSAMDQEATVLEALTLGANDYISKPFKPAEISVRVKRLLKIK